ncbi:glycosyltransferase family 2 protein [Candidatus Woesearchaeota archaeon]|jgi:glycosyltransferase involved in cell wall biosynthesis|nr:glycosyltransferase family 2 protein [Candidatus Woesearchaeota archaeon]MBT5397261.1 glycosyltransferase family 2 protein [Candidatus Woesearchaeota archaeon]MBT5924411.1 glycosyltransferase family 2 protein [Candidatus Woesearchaeota archaeon]MBT6367193.1 glycosyltransferase family 2 protein [Candidatus Woesearchaeota archaeon]MBT7762661.1 glycosyltransferase family 2 protein [Candidatus Woesearchaeota archaeon]
MKVVISIPAYNEERTLPRVLEEIKEITKNKHTILVLNDGSEDKTKEVAEKHGAIVVSNKKNRGLAETFRQEMKECIKLKADIIVHTDADGQYHPQHIPQLIEKVQEGYDLVLGSRFRGKIEKMPFMKRLGNKMFSRVISKLTKTYVTDSTTGYRAFTREVAEDINYINTFTYTQEQIIKAAKQGFKITEIPIVARKTRNSRLFKSPLQYAIKAWINILRIYRDYDPLKFFGYAGGVLFFMGVLIGIYILGHILVTGSAGGIPRVILSAILMLGGIQITIFGFLADMLRK